MRFSQDTGFTMVELLMTMLIIGILSGIAVPQLLEQSGKANDSDAKSGLIAGAKALDEMYLDRETYAVTLTQLRDHQPSLANYPTLSLTAGRTGFSLKAVSRAGVTFEVERTAGDPAVRDCAPAGDPGCPAAADSDGNRW